jgi:DNA repair protein RecO (recombination protein O)
MNTLRTSALILRRINYGEADRILTLLTRDYGKQALIAKGVRKVKSKLAGGIELLSESDISFIKGKGDVGTLVSTQLVRHFSNIHIDLDRMRVAGDFLKRLDACTEDDASSEYYDICVQVFIALNTPSAPFELAEAWGVMRLMLVMGEVINVEYEATGIKFDESKMYRFSYEENRFYEDVEGTIEPQLIKFMRLLGSREPSALLAVHGVDDLSSRASQLLNTSYSYHRP